MHTYRKSARKSHGRISSGERRRTLSLEPMEPRMMLHGGGFGLGELFGRDNAEQVIVDNAKFDGALIGNMGDNTLRTGSGRQLADGGGGADHLLSLGDGGEPDPAQTAGAEGRVNDPVAEGAADDVFVGGLGADVFEFMPLLNAKDEILAKHTRDDGTIDWHGVAGENGNVHDHWVEGVGNDTIADFQKADGDAIRITGHTATLTSIEYGTDEAGDFSLITFRSDQGASGAHDEDPLGTIKVYGDRVTAEDLTIDAGAYFGIDRLAKADRLARFTRDPNVVVSGTDGDRYIAHGAKSDLVTIGRGSQGIFTQAGNDRFVILGDAGEPDPAQTDGGVGRVNEPVAPELSHDVVRGGAGEDVFVFRPLLNAKDEIIAKHTRDDGTVDWRGVAGENGNVHDHWLEGIGNDTILDFNKAQGDRICVEGHTVSLTSIEYGTDARGDYSLVVLRSDQGAGGGAHDGEWLSTIKVYGDQVTSADVTIDADVFYGVDRLDAADANDNSELRDGPFGERCDRIVNAAKTWFGPPSGFSHTRVGDRADRSDRGTEASVRGSAGARTITVTNGGSTENGFGGPADGDGTDGDFAKAVDVVMGGLRSWHR
jgi:Ca2+-binding RTX toxin-like protein